MTRRGPLVGLVVAALLVTGCGGSPKGHAAAPSSTPITAQPTPTRSPAPTAGQCYQLAFAQAEAATTAAAPVDCAQQHTAVTAYVGRMDLISDGHLLSVDSTGAQKQVAEACPQRVASWLGGTLDQLALSRFRAVWFTPSLRQASAGSHWYRCDVIVVTGTDTLMTLPKVKGALSGNGLDTWGTCATTSPAAKDFQRIRCAEKHSWRALSTYAFGPTDKYLGPNASKAANGACEQQAAKASGGALSYKYSVEWPDRSSWKDGERTGLCWVQTSS